MFSLLFFRKKENCQKNTINTEKILIKSMYQFCYEKCYAFSVTNHVSTIKLARANILYTYVCTGMFIAAQFYTNFLHVRGNIYQCGKFKIANISTS